MKNRENFTLNNPYFDTGVFVLSKLMRPRLVKDFPDHYEKCINKIKTILYNEESFTSFITTIYHAKPNITDDLFTKKYFTSESETECDNEDCEAKGLLSELREQFYIDVLPLLLTSLKQERMTQYTENYTPDISIDQLFKGESNIYIEQKEIPSSLKNIKNIIYCAGADMSNENAKYAMLTDEDFEFIQKALNPEETGITIFGIKNKKIEKVGEDFFKEDGDAQYLHKKEDCRKIIASQNKNINDYYIFDFHTRVWLKILNLTFLGKMQRNSLPYWEINFSLPEDCEESEVIDEQIIERTSIANPQAIKVLFSQYDDEFDILNECLSKTPKVEELYLVSSQKTEQNVLDVKDLISIHSITNLIVSRFTKIKNLSHLPSIETLVLEYCDLNELDLRGTKIQRVIFKGKCTANIKKDPGQHCAIEIENAVLPQGYKIHEKKSDQIAWKITNCTERDPFNLEGQSITQTISLLSLDPSVTPRDYRMTALDAIKTEKDDLVFFENKTNIEIIQLNSLPTEFFTKKSLEFLTHDFFEKNKCLYNQRTLANSPYYFGKVELDLNKKEWTPLPTFHTLDELTFINSDSSSLIDIGYCHFSKLYYARGKVKSSGIQKENKILVYYSANRGGLGYPTNPPFIKTSPTLSVEEKTDSHLKSALDYLLNPSQWKKEYSQYETYTDDTIKNCILRMRNLGHAIQKIHEHEKKRKIPEYDIQIKHFREIKKDFVAAYMISTAKNQVIAEIEKEKIKLLNQFCNQRQTNAFMGFNQEKLSETLKAFIKEKLKPLNIINPGLENFLVFLLSSVGVCEQRSKAFKSLADYLGLNVHLILNSCHMYPEYQLTTSTSWERLDLGGGTPASITTINPWENRPRIKEEKKQTITPADRKKQKKEEYRKKYFNPSPKQLKATSNFSDWFNELIQEKNPLLFTTDNQNSWDLHTLIFEEMKKDPKKDYLFINSVDDFSQYLTSVSIENGKGMLIKGPLLELIEKNNGLLFINWSNFTPTQIATYKSILDKHGTIAGHSVKSGIKIIGMTTYHSVSSGEFPSRCTSIECPATVISNTLSKHEEAKEEKHGNIIKLYQHPDWKGKLLGKITLKEGTCTFEDGPLLTAIKNKETYITLKETPKDSDFSDFLTRLKLEKRVYVNGKWEYLPENFTINIDQTLEPTIEFTTVANLSDIQPDKNHKIYYINNQNKGSYLSNFEVDSEGNINNNLPGLLSKVTSKDRVVITGNLSQSDLSELQDYYEKTKGKKAPSLKFYKLQHSANETLNKETKTMEDEKPSHYSSTVFISPDPDSVARTLTTQQKTSHIVDISEQTHYGDLFERIDPIDSNGNKKEKDKLIFGEQKILFSKSTHVILEALMKGETILLKGDISAELYYRLETLFSKNPYLILNGKLTPVPGKLLLATKPKDKFPNLFDSAENKITHTFDWKKTREHCALLFNTLDKEKFEDIFDNVESFLKIASPYLSKINDTSETIISENRVIQLIKYILNHPHKQNPIKEIFHYNHETHSETRCILNVLAKIFLSENKDKFIDKEKFNHAKEEQSNPWLMLNHLSAGLLKEYYENYRLINISDDDDIPTLNNETLEYLIKNELTNIPDKKHKGISSDVYQTQSIKTILATSPYVDLRGTPGTGKTHYITKRLAELTEDKKQPSSYWGEDKIIEWLAPKDKPSYLLLDEANMKPSGYWDFLKGLESGRVYYKGVLYPTSKHHKVIFTGNPESYLGRYHHDFLKTVPKVYFKKFSDKYLKENVIFPQFKQFSEIKQTANDMDTVAEMFIKSYKYIAKNLPHENISLRDLKMMAQRFSYVASQKKESTEAICSAIQSTFTGLFREEEERKKFNQFLFDQVLQNKFSMQDEAKTICIADYIITPKRKIVWDMISSRLALREYSIKQNINIERNGILIEGEPGMGKSQIMLAALKNIGYSPAPTTHTAREKNSHYYHHITVGTSHIEEILLNAFHHGDVVVLDELNLLSHQDEALLTQLLTGKDLQGNTAKNKGFLLLASQNAQSLASENPDAQLTRKLLSPALQNRLERFYETPYSRAELAIICKEAKIPGNNIDPFIDAYEEGVKKNPVKINNRTFFESLAQEKTAHVLTQPTFFQKPKEAKEEKQEMKKKKRTHDQISPETTAISNKFLQIATTMEIAAQAGPSVNKKLKAL